jgi:transposase
LSCSGGPTKAGDACLREALCLAANAARRSEPSLAVRFHRLLVASGKHHSSALCAVVAASFARYLAPA